ncbi:DUF433 domain-containing protein [Candidatus Woesearchaeota archaeon]|nr:DUF433 domain-containing protein [Candidatus Woesearchaeota archaeon]
MATRIAISTKLQEMVKKYASTPALFFPPEDDSSLVRLVDEFIEIREGVRGGKAIIKGTRIAVCDIIADTWSLGNSPNFFRKQYVPLLDPRAIDAAYAFMLLQPEKAKKDYEDCFSYLSFPKDLYAQ